MGLFHFFEIRARVPFIAKFSHELIAAEDGSVVKSLSLFAGLRSTVSSAAALTTTTNPMPIHDDAAANINESTKYRQAREGDWGEREKEMVMIVSYVNN